MTATAKHSLRAIAQRWQHLHAEITSHQHQLKILVDQPLPQLSTGGGYRPRHGLRTADRPTKRRRLHSEAVFAKLCGACPILPSSGKTTRHRLNRAVTARPTPRCTASSISSG